MRGYYKFARKREKKLQKCKIVFLRFKSYALWEVNAVNYGTDTIDRLSQARSNPLLKGRSISGCRL